MVVMTGHRFFDKDVEYVSRDPCDEIREIVLREGAESLLINKADVVALANEFGLVVYSRDAEL